jgi:hypothetical protein
MSNDKIETIAQRIQDDMTERDLDHLDAYQAAKASLTAEEAFDLALALELCPVHGCDYEICRDDENPECRAARATADMLGSEEAAPLTADELDAASAILGNEADRLHENAAEYPDEDDQSEEYAQLAARFDAVARTMRRDQ